jgi:cell division protein FtsL
MFGKKVNTEDKSIELREKMLAHKEQEYEEKIALTIEKETLKLKLENNTLKEKVKVLENAFETLGFDVKDMKDILNKLVDGIVSKNEINVIK